MALGRADGGWSCGDCLGILLEMGVLLALVGIMPPICFQNKSLCAMQLVTNLQSGQRDTGRAIFQTPIRASKTTAQSSIQPISPPTHSPKIVPSSTGANALAPGVLTHLPILFPPRLLNHPALSPLSSTPSPSPSPSPLSSTILIPLRSTTHIPLVHCPCVSTLTSSPSLTSHPPG